MRYLAAALAVISTSLWLGGLVTLAVLVMAVFLASGLDRESAGRATSAMFVWFGRGQLAVAALALIGVFLGYVQRRGGVAVALFVLLGLAAVGAAAFSAYFVPRLEGLRLAGQSTSPDFKAMHKQSEHLMTGLTAVVFAAALLLPAFCRAVLNAGRSNDSSSAAAAD
jgi:hypothetical protein